MSAAARALERLYAVAPKDFTRARNALAAELRKSRDADAAREIARLRRPSAPLWAVNQLSRHARPALERFLDAVDRLRRTQLSDPRGAMEAMRAERAQLEALVERAEHALAEVGHRASAEARRRISDTLLGAAADRRHADALTHGRLTQELHAPGFDALSEPTRRPRKRATSAGVRPPRRASTSVTRRRVSATRRPARARPRSGNARPGPRSGSARRRRGVERRASGRRRSPRWSVTQPPRASGSLRSSGG